MSTQAYRHKGTGVVIAVASDSTLEDVVTGSGQYEAAELEDLATGDTSAVALGIGSAGDREERNGWVTPAGASPEAITGASFTPPADTQEGDDELAALLAKAYEVDTVEGVNGYLDDNPEHAPAVLKYEADNKARTGIVDGRHKAAATPAE